MIYRKQAKTITENEFKSKRKDLIFNLEYILCKDYVYILDSMDMEDYDYDDTSIYILRNLFGIIKSLDMFVILNQEVN